MTPTTSPRDRGHTCTDWGGTPPRYAGPVSETRPESRLERKQRTRRAILDAALELCEDSSLVALSLRQVAGRVGIVPTGFYRHFDSIESLGMALVDESFASLRAMLRDVRRMDSEPGSYAGIVDRSVEILVEHVARQRAHFAFIARERTAGPPAVRDAIRHEIDLCERELATDLARLPGTDAWSGEDLRILSNLIVHAMVSTAEALIAAADRPALAQQIADTARTQLRMVIIGALQWRSRPST